MKHKYQSDLFRRFVASCLAAVFSAGAFSSYVGAMNEQLPDPEMVPQVQNKEEIKVPTGGAKVTIDGKVYEFENIPSDRISSDFDKYIHDDLRNVTSVEENKIVEQAVKRLKFLDFFCSRYDISLIYHNFFEEQVKICDKNDTFKVVKLSYLYENEYLNELIEEFQKPADIFYFVAEELLGSDIVQNNNSRDLFFDYLFSNSELYSRILSKHFKTSYSKIEEAAEKYFKKLREVDKELHDERKKVILEGGIFFLFLCIAVYKFFPAAVNFVYNNSTIKAQKAVDKKQKSTGKTQNSEGENNKSTGKTQKAADEKQKSTGKTQNSAGESNKSTSKAQEAAGENENSKGEIQTAADEKQKFTDKTQSTVIENNKSTNVTQEYTHEDREHEKQGNTTNDSNKYPKTDNGFGAKNLKVILPVALGGTAAVGSNVAAGVIKHFSNKNRQK